VSSEFDESTMILLDKKDLDYGKYPELIAKDDKLAALVKASFAKSKLVSDTLKSIGNLFKTRQIDSTLGIHMLDSLTFLDSITKLQTNALITEKNVVNDQIMRELNYKNSLIKDRAIKQPMTVKQSSEFIYGGIGVLIVALIMFLFIGNVINRQVTYILVPIFAVAAIALVLLTGKAITKLDNYDKARETAYNETKQRLIDIRSALLLYKEDKGTYPKDLNVLIDYIKTGDTYFIDADNDVPNRKFSKSEAFRYWGKKIPGYTVSSEEDSTIYLKTLNRWADTTYIAWGDSMLTERAALEFGMIKRDTIKTPVKEKLYTGPGAKTRNSKMPFSADSLTKMAFYNIPFIYRTTRVLDSKDTDTVKVYKERFEVRLQEPLLKYNNDHQCEERIELILGSLYDDVTTGNWK